MPPSLRILLINDQSDERVLMRTELRREFPDLQVEEVADPEALPRIVERNDFDLAIAAYSLPGVDGLSVLRRLKAKRPEWPVILLIEPENEELAKEAMKNGLDDYVVKSSRHFFHLAATIRSTWEKVQERQAIKGAEERYLRLFDDLPVGFYRTTSEGKIVYANRALAELLGFSNPEEVMAHEVTDIYLNPHDRARWLALMQRDGVVRGFEVQVRRPEGKMVWVRNNARGVWDDQGRVLYYEGSLEDITAHKKDKKALQEEELLFSGVFACIQDGMNVLDETLTIIRTNPTYKEWFAHALPLEGRKCYEAFRNLGEPCLDCPALQALQTGETAKAIVPGFGKDGEIIGWRELYAFPLKDLATGEIKGVVESVRDITARLQAEEELQKAKAELELRVEERTRDLKVANENLQKEIEERVRAEKALRSAETQFRTLVEQSLVGIYILQDGVFRYVNPKLAEIFGCSQEEVTGKSPQDFVTPEDWPLVAESIRKRLAGEVPSLRYTFRGCKKDGAKINVEVHSNTIEFQDRPAIMGALRDITRLTQALEALGRRDAILEAVSFAAAGFIGASEWQQNLGDVLEHLGQATGVSRVNVFENYQDGSGAWGARQFCEWVSPEFSSGTDNPTIKEFFWKKAGLENCAAPLSQGLPVWGDVLIRSRKHSIIDVPIFVEGQWWGIIGFDDYLGKRQWSGEEIEALKAAAGIIGGAIQRDLAQKALQRQQNLLKTIFNTIPDLIVLKDLDLVYRAVNPAFCRFVGKEEEDILGKKDQDLFPGPEAEIYHRGDLRVMESGQPQLHDEEVSGAGGKQWLQVLKTPVFDGSGGTSGILCSCRDITARKQAEATLQKYRARLQTIIAERAAEEQE